MENSMLEEMLLLANELGEWERYVTVKGRVIPVEKFNINQGTLTVHLGDGTLMHVQLDVCIYLVSVCSTTMVFELEIL